MVGRQRLWSMIKRLYIELATLVPGIGIPEENKKESHLGDSLDHQGASTKHKYSFGDEGCHPLFRKELMKRKQLFRASVSTAMCFHLSAIIS